jgi:amino acid adenylation domain-containing protein/FkbM family methyltransferase
MKNVEDIYPLSPLQQGILYHTLHEQAFSMYFEIITWIIEGEVNVPAYEQAWQRAVDRHPVLRSSFVWEGVDEPLQIVRKRAKLPMAHLDWRGLSATEQEERLESLYTEERTRGFELTKPPLMRVTLIRTGDDAYRFVWSYHHALVDGWSCSLIFNDVFVAYEALCRGVALQLPPTRPFGEYIDWLRGQDLSAAESYWRRTLKGFEAATPLGVGAVGARRRDHAGDATKSYREQFRRLPSSVTGELTRLARQQQLTLNTLCLGAWAVLLSRYSGERDVVFGVAVSGRPPMLAGVETMVGMLVNTLPTRIEVEPGRTLLPWLEEIQRGQVELRQYEYSPLVQVQGWSEVPRNSPLFESVLSFENHPVDYSLLKRDERAELRDAVHLHTATGIPINLIIEPGEELSLKILYDFGRYDDDSVRRMLDHLCRLLEGIAADPRQRLSELSPLAADEREQILLAWNNVPRVKPRERLLHEMFEAQAESTPERVALVTEHERYSYRELNGRANRLARRLRASGVGAEVSVAVCVERSAEMVVALLAILKAGGAYVPLDPAYPRERLAFMLADARSPVLLTQQRFLELLLPQAAGRTEVVCLDTDAEEWARESESNNPAPGTTADNLAYFIYTSGSTGRPKGVAITHRNAVVFLYWARTVFGGEQLEGVLASTSISFDLSVFELFAPLSWGGKVILAENALQLPTLAAAPEVTLVNTVPSAMTELVRMKGLPASVRTVNLAGEALPLRLVRQLYEQENVQSVFNLYGPSEDTTYSTFTLVERDGEDAPGIGRPISNTQVYVLDGRMEPVPVGVAGELYVGGDGLARGYFNRPELTAERFVPHPFGGEPGARLYRTGDLARWRSDGTLEFLGRRDHQVKIRGFRIEMGETEAAIEAHPSVHECVVTAREDSPGDKRLVAYVVQSQRQTALLQPKLSGIERERLLASQQHLRLPNGMIIAGHSSLQTSGIYREIFEDLVYLKHGIEFKDGDCVFDVGANIGLFTLFVKQQARNARVYSFEPLPPNFNALRINAALYGLDVNLFECGMSRRSDTATFTFYPHAAAMSSIGSHVEEDKLATRANVGSWLEGFGPAGSAEYGLDEFVEQYLQSESYTCRLTTLSEVIREQEIERIDLLKLDVEKSELDVLEGIAEEDWEKIRQIVIEVHTDELLARISELLQKRGFNFAVDKSTLVEEKGQDVVRVHMLYARRPAAEASSNGDGRSLSERPSPFAGGGDRLSATELRAFLRERLPEYLIPSTFMMLDELPLLPNGKVDRRALPAPGQAADDKESKYVAPRTPVEEIVAGICASVLNLERVSVNANFFEMGGHSLLAAQVISRVRETFKVELSLRKLFLMPTVEGLAQNVETALLAGEGVSVARIQSVPREEHGPLSFSQQRLWFLDQLEPGSPIYNITAAMGLGGELNLDALQAGLAEIIRRHEALRTTFAAVDGRPVQRIHSTMLFALTVEDVSGEPAPERAETIRRLTKEEAELPFDLGRGPLLRVRVLRAGASEHVALLTMHHIISDGWSMGVLVSELATLYTAYASGGESPLQELPIQYADYAVWQRGWLTGEVLEEQLGYWRRQLEGAPPLLELPTDFPRPAIQTYRGAVEHYAVGAALTEQLRALSRGEGTTLFMTLLAAFKVLLARYSGQSDIVIGSDIANRNHTETEGLIGFFVNMLLLRTDLSDNPTFTELLGRTRETALGAYAHQDVPFEKLVEELQPERDTSHSPLFNVVFVLQNAPMGTLDLPGLELRPQEFNSDFTRFDLEFHLWERDGALSGFLIYNKDLFAAHTMRGMLDHFSTLLEAVTADPDGRVEALPLLLPDERRKLLVEWNDTGTEYPKEDSIARQFELQVERTPDAVAVVFGERQLTYDELNRRSNQVAHHLRALGVRAEVPVALCVERSVEMLVGLLGILKAGGFYVPLDPGNPVKRHSFMLEETAPPVILAQEHLIDDLPAHWGQVVLLDSEWDVIAAESEENLDLRMSGDNLAYVLYTSGSTGTPKGVQATQRGVMRLVKGATFARMDADETFLQLAPLSFDASTFEIWGCLLNGGRLVVMPPENPMLEELGAALKRHGVSTLWLTAGLFHLMVDENIEALRQLRQLVAGGDALSATHVAKAARELNDCQLINGYGPTESTTFACCYAVPPGEFRHPRTPIGRPISNTQVYVLDGRMEPVPVGVAGELYVGGDGLARGYFNRPELTAERFVPHPFGGEPGARLYRTGDRARYLQDGLIEFLNRFDFQVKLRGFRIEPGEIEAALAAYHLVREAVVLLRQDAPDEKRLVAYLACDEPHSMSQADWRRILRQQLPDYMIPSAFVCLGQLPLTPNGKIDRRALPAPEFQREDSASARREPRTPVETALLDIWRDLLHLARPGIDDNFFELGGHSLLATQVLSRVRDIFEVEIPLRALFETPTAAGLATGIEAALSRNKSDGAPPISPVSREQELPLSFAQYRLWFLHQLQPDSPFYNISLAIRLTGTLDYQALERSFGELIRRHEALRTTFVSREGKPPVQLINDPQPFALAVEELAGDASEEIARRAEADARRPFDLGRGPLLRVRVLRAGASEHVALLTMHHIISDGWSMGVLVSELATLYTAYASGGESPLQELPIQYADYAVWQRGWLTGEVLEEQLGYWRRQLEGAPPLLELPTDFPRPAIQTYEGGALRRRIPDPLVARLRELSHRQGATLYMTLLATFKVLLSRYSGEQDICVGTPIANRNRAAIEGLIGFFVNTLTLRTQVRGEESFLDLLGRVREVALGAYAHQDVPFEKLVEELHPTRDLSHAPLFQVMLVLQNAPREELVLPGLRLEAVEVERATEKFDLTLGLAEGPEGLEATWTYNTQLFEEATVAQMASHFERLLESVADDPSEQVCRVALLGADERRRLVSESNATRAEFPANKCLHELLEEQAARRPAEAAVVFGQERISFGELNERADKLASHLRTLGVGPDVPVGLLFERGIEMIVGLFGILKAGGAYLPLIASNPPERLRFILENARAPVLLTQQSLLEGFPLEGVTAVCLDRDWPVIGEARPEATPTRVAPHNLAYVIYTSGSTGRPKGVMIEHRSVLNLATALRLSVYAGQEGPLRVGLNAPLAFDSSVKQIVQLLDGHTLLVVPEDLRLDPAGLCAYIEESRLDVLDCTPTQLRFLLEAGLLEGSRTPPSIMLIGGEALDGNLWATLSAQTSTRFYNVYGPAECTVDATACEVRGDSPWPSLGRPLANVRVYVLDEQMEPVPAGVKGELYVGGEGLGRGYLNDPSLTAERFVPDGLSGENGGRLYRTGDVARFRRDGQLEFIGRLDHQVKVRGHRIELGEIEEALAAQEGVGTAAVALKEDGRGEKRLVGYVLPKDGAELRVEELKRRLLERLPEYMVPVKIVVVEELPKTASGKVDRRALPSPESMDPTAEAAAPLTPVETILAGIWEEVLRLDGVSAGDNFFDLGGHSLLATQVMSRVRELFRIEMPLRRLFETPTLAGLSGGVEAALKAGQGEPLVPLRARAERGEKIPLSFAQRRLWFWDQLEPGSPRYNLTHAFRLSGPLNADALEQSIGEIVRHHEIMRTTFPVIDREPTQLIHPTATIKPILLDLGHLPEAEREAEARRRAEKQAQHRFDLAQGPLLLVTLLRIGDEEHVVAVTMHHIISDGWSLGIWVREVAALYESFSHGLPPTLPELPLQYADFALWQHELHASEGLRKQLEYWKRQLDGASPALALPFDYERPPHPTFDGATRRIDLPSELYQELRKLSRREGCTLFMTLLAAFESVLHGYSAQTDMIVGTDVANRNRLETEGLIGFFVNLLVLRTDLSGNPSFRELMGRVRETALAAYTHQDVPFDTVVNALRVERKGNLNPLFQTVFVLQNAPLQALELTGLTLTNFEFENRVAPLDLVFALYETDERLSGAIQYSTELFDPETIERMLNRYRELLESVAANPDQRLTDLGLHFEPESDIYTLPDFPEVKLNRKQLASLLEQSNEP